METSFDLVIIGAGTLDCITMASFLLIDVGRILRVVRGEDVPRMRTRCQLKDIRFSETSLIPAGRVVSSPELMVLPRMLASAESGLRKISTRVSRRTTFEER
jgi:hypothetical protein